MSGTNHTSNEIAPAALEFLMGWRYEIKAANTVIGRLSSSNAIDCPLGSAKTISRTHAVIRYDSAISIFFLEILGKNNLHINSKYWDREKAGSDALVLHHDDVITIGSVSCVFVVFVLCVRIPRLLA